ncbi:Thioredoxin-like fold [Pseudocohnilembus persalinus]|uniref:Thioredoxin-like fold n=1 Tax=Pseudocohnilembus persalinus TaxID=266149 RepID=A0A0V0R8X5_PSEPJ|nr:Thioredoxin-like fold [Pseudocohnilembus persalinus]|eukprot:KRX10762.1 Thioredoxin-like fold [Pseudocohnilembus persalinus]
MNKKLLLITFVVMSSVFAHTFDSEVTILNDSNFVEKTGFAPNQSKPAENWFVMLYAPWCGHCKRLIPTWSELAKQENLPFKVAAVDCDSSSKIKTQFAIRGYPTLAFIDKEGEVYKFGGPRDLKTLLEFGKNGYKAAEKITLNTAQQAAGKAKQAADSAQGTVMDFVEQVGIVPIAVGVTVFVVLVSAILFCVGGDDKKATQKVSSKKDSSESPKATPEDKKRI